MALFTREQKWALEAKRARVSHIIRRELGERGRTCPQVAKELGLSHQAVYSTINGKASSPDILAKLREIGVPEKYLHDPHVAGNKERQVA